MPEDPPNLQAPPAEGWSVAMEHLLQGVLLVDGTGRFLRANAAAARILGIGHEALLGSSLGDSRWWALRPDGSQMDKEDLPGSICLRTGTAVDRSMVGWIHPSGDALWLEVSATPVPGGALLVFDNITDRHLTQAILAARARIVEMSRPASLEEVLRATLDEAEALTGSKIGFFHFVDADQEHLTLQVWSTRTATMFCKAEGAGLHYPVSEAGVWVDALKAREPVVHNDYANLPHRKGLPEGHAEVQRELVVPVLRGGLVVALLGVGNKPFPYGRQDMDAVCRLADLAWDVAETKRAEEALRRSESRFLAIFEESPVGLWEEDFSEVKREIDRLSDGQADRLRALLEDRPDLVADLAARVRILDINECSVQILNASDKAHVLRSLPSYFTPESFGVFREEILALAEGRGYFRGTIPLLDSIGNPVCFELGVHIQPGFENSWERVLVSFLDVTERLQAETRLERSEARYRNLFDSMAEGFAHCRMHYEGSRPVDWTYLSVNPAFSVLTGMEDAAGRRVSELVPGIAESSPDLFDIYGRVATGGVPEQFESYVPALDLWFSVHVSSPAPQEFIATFEIITQRKRAEASLAASEARHRTMLRAAMDGVWLVDGEGRLLEVNESACLMLGCTREELVGRRAQDIDAVEQPEDTRAHMARILREGSDRFETIHRRSDGGLLEVEVSATWLPDLGQFVVYLRDIGERKRAEAEAQAGEVKLRTALAGIGDGIWEWNLTRNEGQLSSGWKTMLGFSEDELSDSFDEWEKRLHPEDKPKVWADIQAHLDGRSTAYSNEHRQLHKDGSWRWMLARGVVVERDAEGRPLRMVGTNTDITESKRAEQDLRDSQTWWRTLVEQAGDGFELLDEEGRFIDVNGSSCRRTGYRREELLGMTIFDVDPDLDPAEYKRVFRNLIGAPPLTMERVHRQKDGTCYPVEITASVIQLGGAWRSLAQVRDVSARKQAEARLQDEQARFQDLVDSVDGIVWEADARTFCFTYVSAKAERLLGHPTSDWMRPGFWVDHLHPEDREYAVQFCVACTGRLEDHDFEYRFQAMDGSYLWLRDIVTVSPDTEGTPRWLRGVMVDITAQKRTEADLKASEERLKEAQRLAKVGHWSKDHRTGATVWSDELYRIHRLEPGGPPPRWSEFLAWVHPEDRDRVAEEYERSLREPVPSFTSQFRIVHDGVLQHLRVERHTEYDADGRQVRTFGTEQDITEEMRLETERRVLEDQVHRAQKMESLGSLAGGVAHDMNNVLGAILGLATLHEQTCPKGSPVQHAMATIAKACLRGRTLVQGLLGFARKGLAEVKVLDLNELVREQAAILQHATLGKVRLVLDLDPALRPVKGDPAALGHALMNLCVNAVDAMPEGGALTLRTFNLGALEAALEVADTGEGMTAEVLARATDPFFTTKALGKGTGLGLSIVYGTLKSHGGRMDLQSAPGEGTRVQLSLPACAAADSGPEAVAEAAGPAPALRVLVVDDDELVRSSLASLLAGLGHTHCIVGSGEEALALLAMGEPFDAVILDLNMPGLGGEGTLPRLRQLRPGLPVLVATGRANQEAIDLVARTPGATLLPKPFSMDELNRHLCGGAGNPA